MFMTGPRSRHQRRCVHAARDARAGRTGKQSDMVYPRCAILQQGMHMKVFSEVYCDRVYFCAERFETGSGFAPPPPSGTPLPSWNLSTPPGDRVGDMCPPPPNRAPGVVYHNWPSPNCHHGNYTCTIELFIHKLCERNANWHQLFMEEYLQNLCSVSQGLWTNSWTLSTMATGAEWRNYPQGSFKTPLKKGNPLGQGFSTGGARSPCEWRAVRQAEKEKS